jgi:hypothetical protein
MDLPSPSVVEVLLRLCGGRVVQRTPILRSLARTSALIASL